METGLIRSVLKNKKDGERERYRKITRDEVRDINIKPDRDMTE